MLEPELAHVTGVVGSFGDLEATIGIEERGILPVVYDVLAVDHEVRNLGAILGCGIELLDNVFGGVKHGGLNLFLLDGALCRIAEPER